jgi:hypothetical protein
LVSLEAARAQANLNIDDAKRGINPKRRLEMASTADGLTVEELFTCFTKEYVRSKGLDSAWLYEELITTKNLPIVVSGKRLLVSAKVMANYSFSIHNNHANNALLLALSHRRANAKRSGLDAACTFADCNDEPYSEVPRSNWLVTCSRAEPRIRAASSDQVFRAHWL